MRKRQTFLFFFFSRKRRKESREKRSSNYSSLLIFFANICSKIYTLRFMRLIKKVSRASSSQYYQFLQKKNQRDRKDFLSRDGHSDFIENFINEIHKVLENFTTKTEKNFQLSRKTLPQYSKISKTFNESTGTGPGRRNGELVWGWIVTAIVRLKKKGYLSSVPMGGIQDPYNVGNHYYGRYAYTGYGGRVPEERLMHGQKHDCQHSTTRDVSSGPTSFLLSTNDKYTNDAPWI